jgi:phosphatidylinositol-3-phosphatase
LPAPGRLVGVRAASRLNPDPREPVVTTIRRLLTPLTLGVLLLAGCSSSDTSGDGATTAGAKAAATAGATARSAPVSKLLVLVVENHSLDQMRAEMPWTAALGDRYGYATHYQALTHPSLPNYLGIAGGSTFGITDDHPPAVHTASGTSVFGQALDLGKTATVYADGMPSPCATEDGGDRYAVRHNPWTYFDDERAECDQHDVPLAALDADIASGDLPDAGMVIPNVCHDAHDDDCDLADADGWLQGVVGSVLDGPDFASGRLAVVITADEDDGSDDNLVLTTVVHPSLRGRVVDTPLTHYSLTRLYEQVLGAPLLRQAATAPDLAAAFGLPIAGS